MRVYCDSADHHPDDPLAPQKLKEIETMGFTALKIDIDMHGRYDATTGKRVAIELEPFKLMWLEEPVPAENIDAMRDIRQSTRTPICCGENLYLRHGFREVLEKHAPISSCFQKPSVPGFKERPTLGRLILATLARFCLRVILSKHYNLL